MLSTCTSAVLMVVSWPVTNSEPVYTGKSERHVLYPDPCENLVKIPEADPDDPEIENGMGRCGGTVWDIGGHSYYNGQYQCYTLYLECEHCGTYDVECV